MRDKPNLMRDQQALMRNQQPSIHHIETQLGQLAKLLNERLLPKNPDPQPQPHVMAI